jgi:hypothetical protein
LVNPVTRYSLATSHREQLKVEFSRAAPLREIYPQLAEVRVEFEFADGTARAPSPQAYSYFPAARSFFRYACPCHTCGGEFDLSKQVAELADTIGSPRRTRKVEVACTGLRVQETDSNFACPVCAQVRVSIVHVPERQP